MQSPSSPSPPEAVPEKPEKAALALHGGPGAAAGAVFLAAAGAQRDQIAALAPEAAKGERVAIHDLRVACRRCREALRVFCGLVGRPAERKAARALRELRRACGTTRDLDVAIRALAGASEADSLVRSRACALQAHLSATREESAREMSRALPELARAALASLAGPLSLLPSSGIPAREIACRVLSRRARRFERAAARPRDLHNLHRLRIETKRLRYTAEILSELPLGYDAPALDSACRALQDALGDGRDLAMAAARLRSLADLSPEAEATAQGLEESSRSIHASVVPLVAQVLGAARGFR
ncbi:MAG: CHAD domain-containing protein [Planctomycetes bacterium]|nr:CHAD domain-containing protein [Planctomycetota bacterium]